MSVLSLSRLAAILVPIGCALAACSSASSSGSNSVSSGAGGAGGAGGASINTENTAATGGYGYSDAAPPLPSDGPLHCVGDEAAWKELTDGPMPCQSGEECCVIMSPCRGDAQIVLAAHQKDAVEAWPYCSTQCNDCVARPIEVACISGSCLGRVVMKAPPEQVPLESPLRHDHCGTAVEFSELTASGKTGVRFWPSGCAMQGEEDGGPGSGP